MELSEEGDLRKLLNGGNVRNVSVKNNIMIHETTIIEALIHIHRHGIIYRDVEPENVFLQKIMGTDKLLAKLGNFSLARYIDMSILII